MFNAKLSGILGSAGFVLSLIIGLASGAGFPLVFIRAGIFGLVFFVLGGGFWILINNFIPELLFSGGGGSEESADLGETSGSRVNITLEDQKILPEMYQNLDNGEEVGNIGDLVSGAFKPQEAAAVLTPLADEQGMDQMPQAGYTENENRGAVSDALPDMDSMAGSFLGEAAESSIGVEQPEPVRRPSGNRTQQLEGDFKPQEIAAGIRTVLKKDE